MAQSYSDIGMRQPGGIRRVEAGVERRHRQQVVAGEESVPPGKGDDAIERIVAKMANSLQLTPLGTTWSYNTPGSMSPGL